MMTRDYSKSLNNTLNEPINQSRSSIITHSRPHLTSEDLTAIHAVLTSGMIAEGEMVGRFEHEVSRYMGIAGGVAASSGTSALFMVLKGLSIGEGDEVILPSYVCQSVWEAVAAAGAQPVLCDIQEDWCMSIDTVRPRVTRRTKAVILVHIFGIVANADGIFSLGIPVIEDCCQAVGAKYDGRMAGTLGQACLLSFNATKLLTTGEGGMVLTNDVTLLKKMRQLKQGNAERMTSRYSSPLTDIQAALGLSQLARYAAFLDRRRAIADYYFSELDGLPLSLPTM